MRLIGKLISDTFTNHAKQLGTLLAFEGPLLILNIDINNPDIYYFQHWVDFDDKHNRWLVYTVSKENLYKFLNIEISLHDLIVLNNDFILIDINENERIYYEVKKDELPEDYISEEDSFFEEYDFTRYSRELKSQIKINQVK